MKNLFFALTTLCFTSLFLVTSSYAQAEFSDNLALNNENVKTANSEASTEKVRFFSNATLNHVLTVESEVDGKFKILDSAGNLISKHTITKGRNNVKLNHMDSGTYLIKLFDEKGKMIKMERLTYTRIG